MFIVMVPKGQKTSIFMRGTNSNHILVLLNGIPINDQSSPKAMFDFGYDFLHGLQQIEIYKGAAGAIFGPAAIGGAINFVTDIDYQNSILVSGSNSRTNSISGNYTYLTKNGWHHNIQAGSSQIEELSTQNTFDDLDGTKNLSFNYNSVKYLDDNTKFKIHWLLEKQTLVMIVGMMQMQMLTISCMLYSHLREKKKNFNDNFTAHVHVHDRYYDTAVKNKYYSKSYTIKGERKLDLEIIYQSDLEVIIITIKEIFKVKGNWGSSARGHSDNLGLFSNLGYKFNDTTIFSAHLRGDSHKYSQENLTYRINLTKLLNNFTLSLSESTG